MLILRQAKDGLCCQERRVPACDEVTRGNFRKNHHICSGGNEAALNRSLETSYKIFEHFHDAI